MAEEDVISFEHTPEIEGRVYDKTINFSRVTVPEISLDEEESEKVQESPKSRSFLEPRQEFPSPRIMYANPAARQGAEEKKKSKNWILPPISDDLKERSSDLSLEDEEPADTSNWLGAEIRRQRIEKAQHEYEMEQEAEEESGLNYQEQSGLILDQDLRSGTSEKREAERTESKPGQNGFVLDEPVLARPIEAVAANPLPEAGFKAVDSGSRRAPSTVRSGPDREAGMGSALPARNATMERPAGLGGKAGYEPSISMESLNSSISKSFQSPGGRSGPSVGSAGLGGGFSVPDVRTGGRSAPGTSLSSGPKGFSAARAGSLPATSGFSSPAGGLKPVSGFSPSAAPSGASGLQQGNSWRSSWDR